MVGCGASVVTGASVVVQSFVVYLVDDVDCVVCGSVVVGAAVVGAAVVGAAVVGAAVVGVSVVSGADVVPDPPHTQSVSTLQGHQV